MRRNRASGRGMRTWPVRLLVLLLVGCGIFTLGTFVRIRLEDRPKRGPFEMNAVLLDLLGERISEYMAEGRTEKLNALLDTLRRRGMHVVVHDAGLQPLADNGPVLPVLPVPPETEAAVQAEARQQAEEARDTGSTQVDFPPPFTFRPVILMADPIDLPGGQHGVLTLRKDMPTPPDMRLPPFVLPLALAMVLAGGVLHLLLRQTSRPIGEVGSALQRFARGDLHVRVNGNVASHGTELAHLASDFNTMAERTEELLQTQRRLLHEVSHEMRSPLSRVALALEMASRTVSPESQRFLERIRRDAERLSALSSHLLATGHLDHQKEDDPPAWFDLEAMLTQLADETDFQARADRKRVVLHVDGPCAPFHGMREMLYGALDNVVQNALKFSPPGSRVDVSLSTGAAMVGPERRHAVISVQDQGPGVPEADLPMLFVPFFRAGNAPRGSGTGLGLAIAQRAVELHGGSIAAENLPEGGLKVTIRLPA